MKNFIQNGCAIDVVAPSALASGEGVLIGHLFGVAATDADIGETVALATQGVFELPKEATTDTFDVGAAVEWSSVNKRIAALSAGVKIGVVVAPADATAAVARVRLFG